MTNERPAHDVTLLLTRVSEGDNSAPGKLLELVYDDLRHLAAAYMQDERSDHTLQATASCEIGPKSNVQPRNRPTTA